MTAFEADPTTCVARALNWFLSIGAGLPVPVSASAVFLDPINQHVWEHVRDDIYPEPLGRVLVLSALVS